MQYIQIEILTHPDWRPTKYLTIRGQIDGKNTHTLVLHPYTYDETTNIITTIIPSDEYDWIGCNHISVWLFTYEDRYIQTEFVLNKRDGQIDLIGEKIKRPILYSLRKNVYCRSVKISSNIASICTLYIADRHPDECKL